MNSVCILCTLFPPVAEICARLACNFCQDMTTVSCWANSLVWVAVCYSQLASRVGEGGGVWQLCLHSVTQPYTTWPRWGEQGGGLHSLPLWCTDAISAICGPPAHMLNPLGSGKQDNNGPCILFPVMGYGLNLT